MIGLGRWAYSIRTAYISANVVLEISDDNGEYKVEVISFETNSQVPTFTFYDIVEEGNTLTGKGKVSLLPGSTIDLSMTFENDTMTGYIKAPYVGTVTLENAKKVG